MDILSAYHPLINSIPPFQDIIPPSSVSIAPTLRGSWIRAHSGRGPFNHSKLVIDFSVLATIVAALNTATIHEHILRNVPGRISY